MPDSTTISCIGERLRMAIEAGQFEMATPLIDQYHAALIESLRLAKTNTERLTLLASARSFLSDRLNLARVMRSQLAKTDSHPDPCYSGDNPRQSTWRVEG